MLIDFLVYLVTFVMMFFAMWLTSKALKFKKQNIKPAVLFALVFIVLGFCLSMLFDLAYSNGNSGDQDTVIFGLISLALFILGWVLSVKFFYKEGWLKTIAASVIVWIITAAVTWLVGAALWQMGAFSL
jgi:peptidoglycan/LPS O-acetylase OafA/YrhL